MTVDRRQIYIFILAIFLLGCRQTRPLIKEGDIIFHTSTSSQSLAIQRATSSKYSHMGIILKSGEAMAVFEAVNPVKFTSLDKWIRRGQGGHFVIKRLRNADAVLTNNALNEIYRIAKSFKDKPYDLYFGWSDDRVYCSELVWKIYERAMGIEIGTLNRLKDFNLDDSVVKSKLRERYGKTIPIDEPVISPSAMFDSPLLEEVAHD